MSTDSLLVLAWVCVFAVYKATRSIGTHSKAAEVCIGLTGGLALFALTAWPLT
ncbi:MAG: hypothetical protein Q8M77_13880 [Hydrogenophaga sp.]|uniref:hypothetical protein n=1 Tax=Hydrogenophaga sp. TaxID=1904254 RepID=UPI0027313A54|nr:hypothetical protein [Hydrogenophaga sp.]MDP2015501.1 hypothetical protein [Hydrogenophaga sp.]MDP3252988.1 hypothetical protein [Hydrogenophaga sp.]